MLGHVRLSVIGLHNGDQPLSNEVGDVRCVVNGDTSQVDLPKTTASGLVDAMQVLQGVEGIAFTHFSGSDVVRHPLVARIVDAYERDRSGR